MQFKILKLNMSVCFGIQYCRKLSWLEVRHGEMVACAFPGSLQGGVLSLLNSELKYTFFKMPALEPQSPSIPLSFL